MADVVLHDRLISSEVLELAGRTIFEGPQMADNVTVDGVARTVAATQFPPTPGSDEASSGPDALLESTS